MDRSFFQGWRLDPIPQFGQFLLVGLTIFICYENIQLRNRLFKLRSKNSNQYPNNYDQNNDLSYKREKINSNNKKRYYRNIGLHKNDDLEVIEDNQVYEIVKLQLLGITTEKIRSETGEVEYL
tara:strand:+ start:829 stop:1197 length:369 start_codon:yes stop_codon:yes gene_type:complete